LTTTTPTALEGITYSSFAMVDRFCIFYITPKISFLSAQVVFQKSR